MVENDEIISFSCFFESGINSLGIKTKEHSNQNFGLNNPVKIAIKKFEQHLGINLINKDIMTNNESFHFLSTEQEGILKEIINLDNKKSKLLKHFYSLSQGCNRYL